MHKSARPLLGLWHLWAPPLSRRVACGITTPALRHLAGPNRSIFASNAYNNVHAATSRSFFSSPVCRQDKKEEDEKEKRMPSDDPSQLPQYMFTSKQQADTQIKMGWFRRKWRDIHINELIRQNEEFDVGEFIQGATAAFEAVMSRFAKGSLEGFEHMMTERIRTGFADTLQEYENNELKFDYDVGPVDKAEVVAVRFLELEQGTLVVRVDVQFVSAQRFTLRDASGRSVGPEGDWTSKASVWRFQSPVASLHWVLFDIL